MPAVVPFIPLIVAGVSGGVAAANARSEGKAQDRSTNAQLTAQRESLAAQTAMSDKAAAAEREAADRAERLQTEARDYDREAARLAREDYLKRQSPYIEMGNQAFSRLSDLLKIPVGAPGPSGPPTGAPMPSQVPMQGGAGSMAAMGPRMPSVPSQAAPGPRGALSSLALPNTGQTAQPQIGAPAVAPLARGVRMVAPTGEVGVVPYDKVAQAITAGARRVSA